MQRSRRAVLLISTVVAWAACATSAHAIGWLPGPTFAEGTLTGLAGVATDAAGGSTVVWVESPGGVLTVFAQRVAADGGTGPKLRLGRGDLPAVEATAAGAVVTWSQPTDDDGVSDLRIAWIGGDGAVRSTGSAGTVSELRGGPVSAAEPDGDVVVVWGEDEDYDDELRLHARRVAANGMPDATADLGVVVRTFGAIADVAITADGRARVAWLASKTPGAEENAVWVARLDAAGSLDGAAVEVSGPADAIGAKLAASAGGAIATWYEDERDGFEDEGGAFEVAALKAARLPSGGAVADTPVTIAAGLAMVFPQTGVVVAPDGTATFAYGGSATNGLSASVFVRRLTAGGALGPAMLLSSEPGLGTLDMMPSLMAGPGGSLVALWVRTGGGYVSRGIAADGALAPQIATVPGAGMVFEPAQLAGNGSGEGIAGWMDFTLPADPDDPVTGSLRTALLDAAPPAVSATIPDAVARGADASFSVTATDRAGIASTTWQFGDGSGSSGATATHAYGRAGSYPVTVTVTDANGNEAGVTRTITVTEPAVVPSPLPPPGGGPAPVPPAPPGPGPVARIAARMKLTKVTRVRGKVTVRGTLDRRAGGRVTLTWAQKIARGTVVRRTVTTRIAGGRFSATVKLTGPLARSRTAGTLTVAYAGNARTLRARVVRTVRAPR